MGRRDRWAMWVLTAQEDSMQLEQEPGDRLCLSPGGLTAPLVYAHLWMGPLSFILCSCRTGGLSFKAVNGKHLAHLGNLSLEAMSFNQLCGGGMGHCLCLTNGEGPCWVIQPTHTSSPWRAGLLS